MKPSAAALDVAAVAAAIVFAWGLTRLVLYPALGIPEYAPAILRPILGFLTAWVMLRRRGERWSSVGLARPPGWALAVGGGIALYLVNMALAQWVVPALAAIVAPVPQPSFMAYVRGNVGGLVLWVSIGWIVGGFIEECLFRGFLLTRVAAIFSNRALGAAVGIVAQALLFGALHLYGGAFAFLFAVVFALANGIFYIVLRRNLWPLIVVHGVWNTVAIWNVYSP
ncbi:MAG: CPBP family intramembrane glutamic endopeptidase [Usitatibacter sp.]